MGQRSKSSARVIEPIWSFVDDVTSARSARADHVQETAASAMLTHGPLKGDGPIDGVSRDSNVVALAQYRDHIPFEKKASIRRDNLTPRRSQTQVVSHDRPLGDHLVRPKVSPDAGDLSEAMHGRGPVSSQRASSDLLRKKYSSGSRRNDSNDTHAPSRRNEGSANTDEYQQFRRSRSSHSVSPPFDDTETHRVSRPISREDT